MGAIALDASVVIAVLSPGDAHHKAATSTLGALAGGDELSMSATAYAEASIHALRSDDRDLVDRFVARGRIEVVAVDRAIAGEAAALRAKHRSLRLADAFVLACAEARGASLMTFDDKLRRIAAR